MVLGWQPGKLTLPIAVYASYEQGEMGAAGAAVLVMAAISLAVALAYNRSHLALREQ